MRFVILIFIFLLSDLVILLEVFADKNQKDIERQSFIKWEKVQNNRSNNLEKIIWKSYNNDESYFEKKEYKVHSIDEYNEFLEKNINNTKRQSDIFSSEIQPYLPLNNFIEKNKFETKVEWKSSFDGGEAGGTGQQNNSFRFDYGINENMQLSTYFSEADDVIYKKINGGKAKYFWQNYSLALKNKIFK